MQQGARMDRGSLLGCIRPHPNCNRVRRYQVLAFDRWGEGGWIARQTARRTCLRHADAPAFSVFSIPCIPCFPDLVVIDDAALRLGCNKAGLSIGFSDCQIALGMPWYRGPRHRA